MSSSPSSPASRLALDPLSHVLAFLGTKAFIAAICVCKGWRSAAERASAWPAWNLDTVKHALDSGADIDEAYSNSERLIKVPIFSDRVRCIHVDLTEKIRPVGNGETRLRASDGITRTHGSRIWQQAQDVRVHCMGGYKAPDITLNQLATGFPRLKLLMFSLMDYDREVMRDALKALNPRLEALICHCGATYVSYALRLLDNLRLLASDSIVSNELRFLHKLESLYLHGCYLDGAVIPVVCELSVKHRLRRFLISYSIDVNLALLMPAEHPHVPRQNDAPLDSPFDSAPAMLESISVKAPITPTTLHVLLRLPQLQHLEVGLKMDPPSVMLAKLGADLPPSRTLTSLHLHCQLGAADIELLSRCTPLLRILNCNGLGVRPIAELSKLPDLAHLTLVCETAANQSLSYEWMQILCALPSFARLSLRGPQAKTLAPLSPMHLRCIAASRNFVRIDSALDTEWLHTRQQQGPVANLSVEDQQQLLRLRVHGTMFKLPPAVFAMERDAGSAQSNALRWTQAQPQAHPRSSSRSHAPPLSCMAALPSSSMLPAAVIAHLCAAFLPPEDCLSLMQCCRQWCLRGSEREYLIRLMRAQPPRIGWAERSRVDPRCYEPMDTEDPVARRPLPWRQTHTDHQLVLIRLRVDPAPRSQDDAARSAVESRFSFDKASPEASTIARAAALGLGAHWAARCLGVELVIDVPHSPQSDLDGAIGQQQRFWSQLADVTAPLGLPLFITLVDFEPDADPDALPTVVLCTGLASSRPDKPAVPTKASSASSSVLSHSVTPIFERLHTLACKTKHEFFVVAAARHLSGGGGQQAARIAPLFTEIFYRTGVVACEAPLRLLQFVLGHLKLGRLSHLQPFLELLYVEARQPCAWSAARPLIEDRRLLSLYLLGFSGAANDFHMQAGSAQHLLLCAPSRSWAPPVLSAGSSSGLRSFWWSVAELELCGFQVPSLLEVRDWASQAHSIRLTHCMIQDDDGIVEPCVDALDEFRPSIEERPCKLEIRAAKSSWTRELRAIAAWIVHDRPFFLLRPLAAAALLILLWDCGVSVLGFVVSHAAPPFAVGFLHRALSVALLLVWVGLSARFLGFLYCTNPFVTKLPRIRRVPEERHEQWRATLRMAWWAALVWMIESWTSEPVWCVLLSTLGAKLLHATRSPHARRKVDVLLLSSYCCRYLILRWCQFRWFSFCHAWIARSLNDFSLMTLLPQLVTRLWQDPMLCWHGALSAFLGFIPSWSWIESTGDAVLRLAYSLPVIALLTCALFGLQWRFPRARF